MLATRILAALVFTPAVLGLIWLGGRTLEVTCFVLGLAMLWEYLSLTQACPDALTRAVAYVGTALVLAINLNWLGEAAGTLAAPIGAIVVMTCVLLRPTPLQSSMHRAALMFLGTFYAGALIPYMARLRQLPENGVWLCFMALLCTWGADTGAYFTGRALGRHKLYPAISPSKTLEGSVGGLVWAVGIACAFQKVFALPLSLPQAATVGAVAALFGTVGDLCESMLKRSVGAKDSGTIIPGHGGVLDRFDAVLFSLPAVYVYLAWCVHPTGM